MNKNNDYEKGSKGMKNAGEGKRGVRKQSVPHEGPDTDLPTIHRAPNIQTQLVAQEKQLFLTGPERNLFHKSFEKGSLMCDNHNFLAVGTMISTIFFFFTVLSITPSY